MKKIITQITKKTTGHIRHFKQQAGKLAATCIMALPFAASAQTIGPSTTQSPYLIPAAGVNITSFLSANDSINGYPMVGVPDGLGEYDNGDGTFTLIANHELLNTQGVPRAHGSNGAFVSKWIIKKSDLTVLSGSDLMQRIKLWNNTTLSYDTYTSANASSLTVFQRFCSADLAPVSALYNSASGKGTQERIYMNGEEVTDGRAMAHIITGANAGTSYQLPLMGKMAFENSVANPNSSDKTIVVSMDDASITTGNVYVYVGTKTNAGNEIDRAGLTNGKVYGLKVAGFPLERVSSSVINPPPAPGTHFDLVEITNAKNYTGVQFDSASTAAGATHFSRPEDGAWDPSNLNDFYFNTTDQIDQINDGVGTQAGRSRLWRLRFTDLKHPELGGSVEAVLDGTEGQVMLDNMAIDTHGHIILLEDVGNSAHNGKVWLYDIATDQLTQIAKHDPARFGDIGMPATAPFNQDEESSGVIDAENILGAGAFIFDDQAHYFTGIPTSVVEGGQLLVLRVPGLCPEPAAVEQIRGDKLAGVCQGTEYTYYVKPVSGATSYSWMVPPGVTITDSSVKSDTITITVAPGFISGDISVTANSVCGSSAAKTKKISSSPVKPVVSGPACVSVQETTLKYAISNPDSDASYTWQVPSDVTIVNGQGTAELTVNWGSFPGYINVTTSNSCSSVKAKYFVSTTCGAPQNANAKTLAAGLSISVFPNPSKGMFNVKFVAAEQKQHVLEVYDINGKLMFTKTVTSSVGNNNVRINVSNLSKGNYILKVSNDATVSAQKLMIE